MSAISLETYILDNGIIEKVDLGNTSLSVDDYQLLRGDTQNGTIRLESNYLTWRYLENPKHEFNVYTYRKKNEKHIKGIFITTTSNKKLVIYDIIGNDNKTIYAIVKHLKSIANNNHCRGIYFSVNKKCYLNNILSRCNFFDTKDSTEVYIYPDKNKWISERCFTSADRNI
jgi:hypothetical protein